MVQKCVASRWLLSASLGWGGGQIRGENCGMAASDVGRRWRGGVAC